MKLLPPWLAHYPRQHLFTDLTAGVIVTILVIPQSLAYALLAGLPPQAGLYASILPAIVYALLGSSMTQAVGPVAITAIMTFTLLSPLQTPGTPQFMVLAAAMSFCSGLITLAFGFMRMGFLSQLLSRPVVSGFISGSAVLIVLSQLKSLLGVQASGATSWQALSSLLGHLPQTNPSTLVIALVALLWLWVSRLWLTALAVRAGLARVRADFLVRIMPLIVLLVSTLVVVVGQLDTQHGVAVVGAVKEGVAPLEFFIPDWATWQQLAAPALTLAFIGMVQGISMAQALAVKRRERVDANRELVGLGAANIVSAFHGGMPVGGGVSRSAVNTAAGAQTPLAGVVSGVTMLLILLLGTQWFERLPLAVLAASIVVAAVSMIDVKAFRQAWAYDRADALALLGTALGVMVWGVQLGIALGICLSLATLLLRASTPHIAVIGRIPGTEHFRNVERHGALTIPGVLLLRIDESLFFGNLSAVESRLQAELMKDPNIHDVVLIMSAVNRVDATAMEVLNDINRELLKQSIRVHLAEVKGPVQDRLVNSPLWKSLSGSVYLSVNAAFEALDARRADTDAAWVV